MKRKTDGIISCMTAGIVLASGAGWGATLVVDRIDDDPGQTACTEAPIDCTLRGAVIFAELSPGPDEILLPADTITLTTDGAGGAEVGDIEITTEITIRGMSQERSVITGDGNWNDRAFDVEAGGTLLLEDLALVGLGSSTSPLAGGALVVDDDVTARAVLRRVRLAGNRAFLGGAISIGSFGDPGEPVRLEIYDSLLENNRVDADLLAGVFACYGGAMRANAPTLIENSTIRFNEAVGGDGGGICANATDLTLNNVFVDSNVVPTSGGRGAGAYLAQSTVHITDSTFLANVIVGGTGGALYVDGGELQTDNTSFAGNTARGGGLYLLDAATTVNGSSFLTNGQTQLVVIGGMLSIADSNVRGAPAAGLRIESAILDAQRLTVSDQSSTLGGGLEAINSQIFLNECWFSGNQAFEAQSLSGLGGAIYLDEGVLQMDGCTLSGNQAVGGGGALTLSGASFSQISNSTFSNNTANSAEAIQALNLSSLMLEHLTIAVNNGDSQIELINSSADFANNAIDGFCNLNLGGGTPVSLGGNVVTNPACQLSMQDDQLVANLGLTSLADFGGWAPTHLPVPGSPLLEVGLANCTVVDQRGQPRAAPCDGGAVELQTGDDRVFRDGFESPL